MIDIHTHLLPALDDGVKTLDESLQVLQGLSNLGFTSVVATPHFYPGKYVPSAEAVSLAIKTIQTTAKEQKIPISIIQGRECYFDPEMTRHPEKETFPFLFQNKKFQLIELPMGVLPMGLSSYVTLLLSNRIQPILAHVERYPYLMNNLLKVDELSEMGMEIQVDLLSFISENKALQKWTWKLLEENKINHIATDIHRPSQLPGLEKAMAKVLTKAKLPSLERFCALI